MRKAKTSSLFLKHLEYYVNTYMTEARGLSINTVSSYKTTFKLLIKYMYTVKNIPADEITFDNLDVDTLSGFISWLETERNCSASTRGTNGWQLFIPFLSMRKIMISMLHLLSEVPSYVFLQKRF